VAEIGSNQGEDGEDRLDELQILHTEVSNLQDLYNSDQISISASDKKHKITQ